MKQPHIFHSMCIMHLVGFRCCLIFQLYVPLILGRIGASKLPKERNTRNFLRSAQRRFNNTVHQLIRLEEIELELEYFPVIVGVNNDDDGTIIQSIISRLSKFVRRKFKRINAFSAVLTRSEMLELKENPNILYIEDDTMVYPNSDEATLYGLQMVQAFAPILSKENLTSTAACNDPNSFKIGIVDSGLAINHPDIPCLPLDSENTNCIGKEFGIDADDGLWHNPVRRVHGTHVTGTIGANGRNNIGIQGIVNDGNVCFIIGRVFGESSEGTRISNIFDAIEWVADQGADVINLSLGVSEYHTSGDTLMQAIYEGGALIVAASGNSGTTTLHYPANYKDVLSVGAVDAKRQHASFSQHNSGVDIVAPGVDILSTQPLNVSSAIFLSTEELGATGLYFEHSVRLSVPISGLLVLCPNYGGELCPGSGGHICLIERGQVTFEEKTLNCQLSGGVASIIYNNEAGSIEGTMSNSTSTTIPAIQTSYINGEKLISKALGMPLTIEEKMGYGYLSGTSMAAPHVSGVIAKIWRNCPACTNQQVEKCILNTTIDLGDQGKDDFYGYGLVQSIPAFMCLKNDVQCC